MLGVSSATSLGAVMLAAFFAGGCSAELKRWAYEGFGRDGGYIMSASDHFFDVPPENLRTYADAAKECVY